MMCAFNHLLSTARVCQRLSDRPQVGGREEKGPERLVTRTRLFVRPIPPIFGVACVAFKFCNGQPKCQVGNDAVWEDGPLADDADALL